MVHKKQDVTSSVTTLLNVYRFLQFVHSWKEN